jgi:hypothetical protein
MPKATVPIYRDESVEVSHAAFSLTSPSAAVPFLSAERAPGLFRAGWKSHSLLLLKEH